jgi:hypothetical protein
MGSKKRFKEMSPARRMWAYALTAVSVALVLAAERDIGRRSETELLGSKRMWRLLSLNALGAITYFQWGRRVGRE